MDHVTAKPSVRAGATPRSPNGPAWWALAFGVLTTAGLAVLTWGLFVVHALSYGVGSVVAPETEVAAPETGRDALALTLGVLVHVASASASLRLAPHTPIRTWPAVLQGLGASLIAVALASCALLLMLGISPLGFLLAL